MKLDVLPLSLRTILLASLVSAAESATPAPASAPPTIELIADATFERGFRVKESGSEARTVSWHKTSAPVWEITHHHSKSSFADAKGFTFTTNGLVFRDDYGMLAAHPSGEDADLVVGINAAKEFDDAYRQKGDPWPHIYVSQRISAPGGHLARKSPALSEITSLDFAVRVRLLHDHRNQKAGHNPRLHAAQFLFFLTIQNLNHQSAGYGDYYWFGIALYDDRESVTSLHAMHDAGSPRKKGTDKLIYNIGIKPFTNEVVAAGRWVTVRGDLLPHIVAGLSEAWKRGYLPASQELGDYRVGSGLVGWEVPGLNDAAIALKDLRATATLRLAERDLTK